MKKKKLVEQAAEQAKLAVFPVKNNPYGAVCHLLTEVLEANVDEYYTKIDNVDWDPYDENWDIDVTLRVGALIMSRVLTLRRIEERHVAELVKHLNKLRNALQRADAAFTEAYEGPA